MKCSYPSRSTSTPNSCMTARVISTYGLELSSVERRSSTGFLAYGATINSAERNWLEISPAIEARPPGRPDSMILIGGEMDLRLTTSPTGGLRLCPNLGIDD